ncbi:Integrase family protein [Moritella viscosa]|nr:Integrase family protein [Moritella viscosa]
MSLPPLIEKNQRDWLFKTTLLLSKQPERDACLLGFFFGSAATTIQINRIMLKDVLHKYGRLNSEFQINGSDHIVYLESKLLRELTTNYLKFRVENKVCLGDNPDQFLGLDPDEPLFISYQNKGFSIVRKQSAKGVDTFTCDALNRHIKQLMKQAGIEQPSVLSGRRTFAVNLQRLGYDFAHIHALLNNKSVETTKRLLTTDPVSMGEIAKQAF